MVAGNPKPLVFISHKHSDSEIGTAVAKFIRDRSLGGVDVFLSSNWTFDGPRFGGSLNSELMRALWNSDVLILIYTSADQDWSYCMWECGVATHRDSPDTRIIVFQCGRDVPTPFSADLRVDVRNPEHVRRFTNQLLTNADFFPGRGQAIAPSVARETVEKAAEELFNNLKEVIPPPADGQIDEWPAWPFLRLELPKTEVERLESATAAERIGLAHQVVQECGVVVKSDARAAQIFGLASFPDRYKFKELLRLWKDQYPSADATWFDSCCEQIMVGARREFPIIRWSPLREVGGDEEFTPVLSRVKRLPFGGSVQFDLYFYNLSDPRAISVTDKMIPMGRFFYKNLGEGAPDVITLKELVGELNEQKHNRIPVLDGDGHPKYIIHRSMIDRFVTQKVLATGSVSLEEFTLADLLSVPEMRLIFEETFVVVSMQASVAEAKSAMVARAGCSDVFVTRGGSRDEPVIGWLTNVDIARNS